MKIEKTASGGATIALEPSDVSLMKLALERAMFVDTPPGRQEDIFKFADDLLRALGSGAPNR